MIYQTLWASHRLAARSVHLRIQATALLQLVQARTVHYEAIVAGAGPAGLAVVGNLLENRPNDRILWIDPEFRGGRFNKEWREVPSNTKVKLFTDYAKAVQPFRDVIDRTPAPNAITAMGELQQDKGCPIAYAADMCLMLTDGVCSSPQVDTGAGSVRAASYDSKTSTWTITTTQPTSNSATAPTTTNLILCTGSHPHTLPNPVPHATLTNTSLTLALQPSKLSPFLPQTATVAVIGASHSAVLVLLNLFNLTRTTHPNLKVHWFTRNPLRYAEYKDGWILRDNTGLKGIAADFAREHLEDATLLGEGTGWVRKVDCSGGKQAEQGMYERWLPECSHIVTATGFERNELPVLERDGVLMEGGRAGVTYDHLSGGFVDGEGRVVTGLYGAGIAFPERVTDPLGNVEMNVGLFKFMKYLRRVVPEWVGKEERRDSAVAGMSEFASARKAEARV